ncbi:Extradiol aromatic ring-opening dioxygenase [Microthyrium microscopicum]|uniref:Extradiol aromatic ring-opening dioxygenase n=1 Tax=Microthyrium microscopicum TaxID=703497 RepID=A0A6A6UN11_9PEZI|nr:Extradiol aromatic ring-opening dioxygenase [Microthyrium microscopicum]
MTRGAVISLSHGGGPMPVLGDPGHAEIVKSLKNKVPKLLRLGTPEAPRAIVLVTAHWSETKPTISNGEKHNLLYDYGGFPPEAYKLQYPAPGEPAVAKEVFDLFKSQGLGPRMDSTRGWDHGVFIPMLLIDPKHEIPIVQISVLSSEDPETHFTMGQALSKLRDSNVAIIGSGFASIHNLRVMFSGEIKEPPFKALNEEWSKAVTAAATEQDLKERSRKFTGWREWPGGKKMHPPQAGEHFMPLIVCAGAGGDGVAEHYKDAFMGLDVYSYYWV